MSLVKTRAEVRALVQRRARIVDHLNAHPSADLNIDLDESYRCLRDLATESRWSTFLKTTGSLTLPIVAAATGENYAAIPVPTDCRQVKRLETKLTSSWVPAEQVGLGNLRQYNTDGFIPTQGRWPFVWVLLDGGMETTEAANTGSKVAGVIALAPIPTSGSYQVWYLPEFVGTSADSGASGFYAYANQAMVDYHVFHCAVKCLISDNDSQGMMDGLVKLLGKAEQTIQASAPSATGPRTWRRSRYY
jgi:hypothetical protein